MISKELLSEVFKKEVECAESNLCYFEEYTSCMQGITFKDEPRTYWNIHELAHKCKEWAFKQGLGLAIYWHYTGVINIEVKDGELVQADTEPEAIFKACQWILDNKDKV